MNFFAKTLDKAEKEVYNESIKNETGAAVPRNGKETEMKKIFALLLCLVLAAGCAFSLSSCSEDRLTVYTEAGFAPFEYIKDGRIVGVDIDIMQLVAEKLGKTLVFENVEFDKIIDAVKEGKLTKVGAAGLSINEERKAVVDFSKEYYTANLYVIYKKADAATYESPTTDGVTGVYWDSLKGKKVAVQNGTTSDIFLADELSGGTLSGSGAQKTGFSSLASALSDIGLNSDVLIIDELPAKKLVEGKDDLTCAPLYWKGEAGEADSVACDTYAICVTKGETEILNAINEVLDELGKEGIEALINKHLGIQ